MEKNRPLTPGLWIGTLYIGRISADTRVFYAQEGNNWIEQRVSTDAVLETADDGTIIVRHRDNPETFAVFEPLDALDAEDEDSF